MEIIEFYSNCRCCLKNIDQNEEFSAITSEIHQQFYDLTQISLDLSSENYSKNLCEKCKDNLQIFTNWRQEFIKNQKFLEQVNQKEFIDEQLEVSYSQEIQVKVEPLDLLDESIDDEFNDYFKELPSKNESTKSSNESHGCKFCSLKFNDVKLLGNHCINKHKELLTSNEIKEIRKRRIDDRKLVCPKCGIITHYLKNHMERMHLNVKRFFCDHCEHKAFHKSEMEFHMLKHREPIFICDYCLNKFRRKSALKIHIKRIHLLIRTETKKYNRNAPKKKGLCNEENVRIKCQHCEKDILKSYFKSHIEQVHTLSESGEICEICQKRFKNKRALIYHKRNHKEKVFKCDYPNCDKAYFVESRLIYHKSVHKNIREFKCTYEGCDKSYFIKRVLNMHVALFHEKYSINCPVDLCKFSVGRRDYMRNHVAKQHKDLPTDILNYYIEQVKEMELW